MDFKTLNEKIPHVVGKAEKVLHMEPYPNIRLRMPGRHQKDTSPPGGDFVVEITESNYNWNNHQFTHVDIFNEVEARFHASPEAVADLMLSYLKIVRGSDPMSLPTHVSAETIQNQTFFCAVQCLAVAEHRRYKQHERLFGGRYLPFRFAAGIAEGLWTAGEAANLQRRGRPGVEQLEANQIPELTKSLKGLTSPRPVG